VLKDLVVDLDAFFSKVASVEPWLAPADPDPPRERRVAPGKLLEPDPYVNCILCASCHAVCPVAGRNPDFLGPAVLARQYRFITDPRDGAAAERRARVDTDQGAWGCDMVWQCVKVCPQGVPPTEGIARIRARIKLDQTQGGGEPQDGV
jgi:succinate dehydrogenase / fumarate reductase iron-sulfur subunit